MPSSPAPSSTWTAAKSTRSKSDFILITDLLSWGIIARWEEASTDQAYWNYYRGV